jgi:acyl-CoA thioester hydrolase
MAAIAAAAMPEPAMPDSGAFAGSEHRYRLRVFYEDTDAAGIVYYANYLKFIERARTEMMRLLGFEHTALRRSDAVHWAVRSCAIHYRLAARLDDVLTVTTTITAIRGASLDIDQIVAREGKTVADARLELVCITGEGRPARLPLSIRQSLGGLVKSQK